MLYMLAKHFIEHLGGTKANREENYQLSCGVSN